MRTQLVILLLASVASIHGQDETQDGLNYQARNLKGSVVCIQNLLKAGKADIDLPPFDPFEISDVTIDLSTLKIPFLKGTLRIFDFAAADFVNWDVTHSKYTIFGTVELTLEWATTSIIGNYELDASFFGMPLKGSGKITGSSGLAELDVKASINILTQKITKITIKPSLDSANLHVDDFTVGKENKTQELNDSFDIIVNWLLENLEVIGENLSKYLTQALTRSYATTYSMSEILAEMKRCIKLP